jgi:hypothetical protein
MNYTASQIKDIGGKRFIRKRAKRIILLLALCGGWVIITSWLIIKPVLLFGVIPVPVPVFSLIPAALVIWNIAVGYYQSRKLFYARVKADPTLLDGIR